MAANIPIGGIVRFINPNDGQPDVGRLDGWAGGDLKVLTRDGYVYVDTRSVMAGGRKNRSRKNRKGSRKANRSRKNRNRKNRKSRKNRN